MSLSLLGDVASSPQAFNIVNVNVFAWGYPLSRASNDFTILDDGFALLNRDESDLMSEGYGLTCRDDLWIPRAHQGYPVTHNEVG